MIHRITSAVVSGMLLATIAVAVPVLPTPPAGAGTGLKVWYGTVTKVNDGDTFEVSWRNGYDGPAGLLDRIRVVGVDTNETASDQCFAQAAKTFSQTNLPVGTIVRVEARDEQSSAGSRPLRHVFYGAGYRKNLAVELVRSGLGLAASYDVEPDYRGDYFRAAERASIDQVGMWGPDACGGDASTFPRLDVTVNYDAAGSELRNLNDEWIQIRNEGSTTLNMDGWTFRSSARNNNLGQLILPDGVRVAPGAKIRIRMGRGTNNAGNVYMGLSRPFLGNDEEVLYLRDRHLNIRVFQVRPCALTCEESGTLVIDEVTYDPSGDERGAPNTEWVRVRNIGAAPLDLTDWKLNENSNDYHFADGTVIAPGATLTIRVGSGRDRSAIRYWGNATSILNNSGEQLRVYNKQRVLIDCFAYGSGRCTDEPVRGAIRLTAHHDAKGNDARRPNGEWVALENTSDQRVDISRHRVIVGEHRYTFPTGTRIGPGARLRLRVGAGSATASNHYWGQSSGIMVNSGGSVVLRDRGGQVLIEHRWPCTDCGPDGPFVIAEVHWNARGNDARNPNGEWIRIRNAGIDRANLRDHLVTVGKRQYVFTKSHWLRAGESLLIRMGRGRDTATGVHWGSRSEVLVNTGRRVVLQTPYREQVDCEAWGRVSCAGA